MAEEYANAQIATSISQACSWL